MAHVPETHLSEKLLKAAELVPIGVAYTHYKQPDKTYRIIGHAILEANDAVAVIYQAEYGERITFARSLASWMETVEWQGDRVPRFRRE